MFVDIHPNRIASSDGFQCEKGFSSGACFIADSSALRDALEAVCERNYIGTNKLFYPKESAHIRIWPGKYHVSVADVAAIGELADELFIEPVIEVVGSAGVVATSFRYSLRC